MLEPFLRWMARRVAIPLLLKVRRPAARRLFRRMAKAVGSTFLPPKSFSDTTRDWISQADKSHQTDFCEIFPEEIIRRPPPVTVEAQVHWKFREAVSRPSREVFLAGFRNGRVIGSAGWIVTPDDTLLCDVSHEWFMERDRHSLFYRLNLPPPERLGGTTVSLAVVSGSTYYHWMTDVLPRLAIIEKAGRGFESIDHFIVNGGKAHFIKQALDLLEIPEDKRVFTSAHSHYACERLVLPSMPGEPGWTPGWVAEFLREKFLAGMEIRRKGVRIYISRQRAKYRRLENESEIRPILAKYGFEEMFLEGLDLREQVRLFASAEAIISLHGAGLTNLAFCPAEAKVLEIFSPNYVNPCFWTLAGALGLNYHYMLGAGASPREGRDPHNVEEDIRIDPAKLQNALSAMGVS